MWNIDWRAVGVICAILFQFSTLILVIFVKFNDLKHAEKDIEELKQKRESDLKALELKIENNKKEIVNIFKEGNDKTNNVLEKLFKEIRKIEKLQVKRDTLCNERHGKK